jgi:hypothetical protein
LIIAAGVCAAKVLVGCADPMPESDLTENDVVDLAAQELCPGDPNGVIEDLYAGYDTTDWFVSAGARQSEAVFLFDPSGDPYLLPISSEARQYVSSLPATCTGNSAPNE